ncbi:MAG: hypothetical protein ACRECE_08550 [Xanthobacteraceae bacterium]
MSWAISTTCRTWSRSPVFRACGSACATCSSASQPSGACAPALHVACACQGGAYAGKWTVVVDEDIDAGDLDHVLWAMCTRFDPNVDIDLVQRPGRPSATRFICPATSTTAS